MKTAVLIPARAGSKRIPNKNVKELGGKPLIVWSIETAMALNIPTYVSTDSRFYAEIAYRADAEVIHRPDELAADHITDLEVITHALTVVDADLIVYLRPTTPFRDHLLVGQAIDCVHAGTGLRSVEEMSESAYKCFQLDGWYLEPLTGQPWRVTDQPNQLLPKTFHPNGYVDICKADLIRKGDLWGDKVLGFITPRTIEIDSIDDWRYAEYEINNR
uniref:Putative cytidylyltransferase n=1 Tax=viral metagenome TaxID=1070528 RepID=A0A6M3KFN8_9ZZZZ